jgi:hypothetical protein
MMVTWRYDNDPATRVGEILGEAFVVALAGLHDLGLCS